MERHQVLIANDMSKHRINIKRHPINERGSILIVVIVLVAVLALVGTITVMTVNTDIKISGNYKASVRAFSAAEAGVEEARALLRGPSSSSIYIGDTSSPPNELWSVYVGTSSSWQTSDDPDYDPDYTNTGVNSLQSEISYWVKVRHKREYDAEQDGHGISTPHYHDNDGSTATHTINSPGNIIYYGYGEPSLPATAVQFSTSTTTIYHPVEIITAYGSSGGSLKTNKIECVRNVGPPVVSPMYSRGDVDINGTSASINGTDNCEADAPRPPIYLLNTATLTEHPAPTYNGNPPSPQSGPVDIDIPEYVNTLKSEATITITSDQNGTTYGNTSNYVTCYSDTSNPYNVQGLKLQNITGYGLLLIDGDLTLGGGFVWHGLILVNGILTLSGGGSGINILGSIMANQTVDVNGGLVLSYDSCTIDNAMDTQSLNVINWEEVHP